MHYSANPDAKWAASRAKHSVNPEPKKAAAAKMRYSANPEAKRAASMAKYNNNTESMKAAFRLSYKCKSSVAKAASRANYIKRQWVKIAASKENCEQKKEHVNLYHRGKYALNEPKAYTRHQYAVKLKKKLFSKPSLRLLLRKGFKESHESIAKKE